MSSDDSDTATRSRQRLTLLAVCVATFMLLVDITIVNVGLPSIQRELHASLTGLQWVVDAYALSLSALILTAGVLSDRYGRRLVFTLGVAGFTFASLACGLANSSAALDIARAVQGIGGAAMFATSLALIAQEFSGPQRGAAIAAWGSTIGAAVAAGPLLGGLLTQGFGWRWIFFVNLPIGIAVVYLAKTRLAEHRSPHARGLDLAGLVSFSAALLLLILGLLRGNSLGWSSATIIGSLAGGAAMLIGFVIVERRVREPMLDLSLFSKPTFVGVSIGTFAIGAGMFAMFLYLSIYLQGVLGYGPLGAGLRLLPVTLMVLVVPLATRSLAARVPARVHLGGGLLLVGVGLLLMRAASPGSAWTDLLPGFILAGVGVGLSNPAIGAIAVGVVEPARSGMASGINNTLRIGGLATGVAALGTIFQHQIAHSLGSFSRFAAVVASSGTHAIPKSNRPLIAAADRAFVGALDDILLFGGATVLVGAVAAFALIRARDLQGPARTPGASGSAAQPGAQEAAVASVAG